MGNWRFEILKTFAPAAISYYINFMLNPKNVRNCGGCPENLSLNGGVDKGYGKFPCGMDECFVEFRMRGDKDMEAVVNGIEIMGSHKVSKTFWYDENGRHVADKHNYIWKDKKSGERVLWGYIVPDTKEFYLRSLFSGILGSASLEAEIDDEGVYDFGRTYCYVKGTYTYDEAKEVLITGMLSSESK